MIATLRNVIGCWYEAGDAGTWLTWFVNQHKNFTNLPCSLQYGQSGYDMGHIPTDYSCVLSNWTVAGPNKTTWHDFLNLIENRISQKRSTQFEKQNKLFYRNFCYKLIPFHNPLSSSIKELQNLNIENKHNFLIDILTESNTSTILYPVVNNEIELFARRLSFIRPQYTVEESKKIYIEKNAVVYNRNKNYMKMICNNVVTVEIDKLVIHHDLATYKKLCNDLRILPLKNWKTFTEEYYRNIYLPWVNVPDSILDSRNKTNIC